ncbi:MAG: motility associated factor glycosyltransferase family protein [Clostridium sp.]
MEANFQMEKSKDGYDILRVNLNEKWVYIGSKYNQTREIDKFINSFGTITLDDIYVVIGLSCGEHIKELLKVTEGNENKIFIFEPNKQWLDFALENEIIKNLTKVERICLTNNINDIKKFFKKDVQEGSIDRIKFSAYANYNKLYLKQCKEVMEYFRDLKVEKMLTRNTNINLSQAWFKTLMNNFDAISKSTPLNYLTGKYENVPAIIVSAGPSLEKNIDQLKGVENALILSGGRTLKPLLEKKIEPHGLVVIDPADKCYDLVDGYIDKIDCPLFFYDGTNSDVVNNHKGPKVITGGNPAIDKIFNMDIEGMNFGGSVAHSSALLAATLGCNPIIFIGQDLAYTNDKGHADIANGEKFENYKSNLDIYVDDIYGNKVRTSLPLNAFRLDFEKLIDQLPEFNFIDATEGGAYIKGTKVKTLKETLDEIDKIKVSPIKKFLKDFDVKDNIVKELEESFKIIGNTIKKCEDGLSLIIKFKNALLLNNQSEIERINLKLDKLDEDLRSNINNLDILESLLVGKIYEIEQDPKFIILKEDTPKEVERKILGKSIEVYKELKIRLEEAENKIDQYLKK